MDLESALRRLLGEVVREELARVLEQLREAAAPLGTVPEEGYVDVNRAAELVGVQAATIRSWIQAGRLQ